MDELADDQLCTVDCVYEDSGTVVISLAGELDASQIERISLQLNELLTREPEKIVFDMGGLTFMDSTGIGLMIQTKRSVSDFEIQNAGSAVRRVIEATGLSAELGLEP